MADNLIYFPEVNPVIFYDSARANLPIYFTRFMDKWMFSERIMDWQHREEFSDIWQTTDIIRLQFEANFDPIIVKLLDSNGNAAITLPALIGLPNSKIPGLFSFEVEMSLAGVTEGCYILQVTAGTGPGTKIFYSNVQSIFESQIRNSILLEYWDSKSFYKDVIWKTGIRFQKRIFGHLGFLEKPRKDILYHDDRNNPQMLNSTATKQWPLFCGDEFGIPDDLFNLIDEIWGLDNVLIDGKPFGISDGGKVEFLDIGDGEYPKRGIKYTVEEGINRNSRIFAVDTDTTKKIMANIIVEGKVFGDLSNQGSSDAVPIANIE